MLRLATMMLPTPCDSTPRPLPGESVRFDKSIGIAADHESVRSVPCRCNAGCFCEGLALIEVQLDRAVSNSTYLVP